MKILNRAIYLFVFLLFVSSIGTAQQPTRLSDDEVKKVIVEASKTSDKFRDAFKKVSFLTTKDGAQVDVQKFMSDYKDTFQRFKDGFDSDKTPNSDLGNLFRMTGEIDGVMNRNPDAAGAGSEWQAHKFNMDRLAQAFHTSIAEDAPHARRMSDDQVKAIGQELQQASKSVGKSIKDAMKKDKSIDKGTLEATEQSLKTLEKDAETLKKLINDQKPLSVEMQNFLKQMDIIKSFINEHSLGSAVQSQWDQLESKASRLTGEYGIS